MHFLDTPWVLWGIIIALSSGYAISLVVALVYGCVKCSKFIQDKIIQFRNQRKEDSEPHHMQLRQLQQNLQQHQV